MLIAAMPMMFGAMRLARFNSQLVGFDKDFFKGLPIPSAAIVVCAYVQRYFNPETGLDSNAAPMLAPLAVIVSLLMVSTIKYDSLPKFSRRGIVQHPLRFTFVIVCATAIILTQGKALFPCFVVYLATGPIRYIVEFAKKLMHPAAQHEEESVTSDV
jgi:CDP-diacylglycerol--serine O-phosphatidyltransferase